MEAWKLLIGSDIGLMSLLTIGVCVVIGVVMIGFYKKQADIDARNAK